jgi:PAS domain S-box-containing protein
MKIKSKLLIIFLLLALVPVAIISYVAMKSFEEVLIESIGSEFVNKAKEKADWIDYVINERIADAKNIAASDMVIEPIRRANRAYAGLRPKNVERIIKEIDTKWIESGGKSAASMAILHTTGSRALITRQSKRPDNYGEIFTTDARGATVAMTKPLSDYFQADEEWWSDTYRQGLGGVFLDYRGYDESIGAVALGVVVPVIDGDTIIGILKVNYKVQEMLYIVSGGDTDNKLLWSFLLNSQGDIVVSTEKLSLEDAAHHDSARFYGKETGWSEDFHNNEKTIEGYARVKSKFHARVDTPGAIKGVSGERWEPSEWLIFIEQEQKTAFAPIMKIGMKILVAFVLIMLLTILLAAIIARSLSLPLVKLAKGAAAVGAGELDTIIDVTSADELGELARAFNSMTGNLKEKTVSVTELETEINERKQAEENLVEVSRLNEKIISESPMGLVIYDHTGQCVSANRAAAVMLGATQREMLAQNYNSIEAWKRSGVLETALSSIEREEVLRNDFDIVTTFGKHALYDCRFVPFRSHGRKHLLVMLDDISERKAAENALKKSEASLKRAQEITQIGSFALDPATLLVTGTEELFRIFSIPEKIQKSATFEDFAAAFYPDDLERNTTLFRRALEFGEEWDVEHRIVCPDGVQRWVHNLGEAITDENGTVVEIIGTVQDITERKGVEEAMVRSLAEKEFLLKEVHHRVKNNLQVISSILNLQSGYITDESLLSIFKESQDRIKSMALIHEKLYQSSELTNIDFREYVETLSATLFHSYALGQNVKFSTKVADVLMDIDVAVQLGLLLNELCSNAMKHAFPDNRAGELTIELGAAKDAGFYTLSVADNGVGLPDDFDMEKTASMGMRLISAMVTQLEGTLKIEKTGGTKFSVTFPHTETK